MSRSVLHEKGGFVMCLRKFSQHKPAKVNFVAMYRNTSIIHTICGIGRSCSKVIYDGNISLQSHSKVDHSYAEFSLHCRIFPDVHSLLS